jgi:hypothetical protein
MRYILVRVASGTWAQFVKLVFLDRKASTRTKLSNVRMCAVYSGVPLIQSFSAVHKSSFKRIAPAIVVVSTAFTPLHPCTDQNFS